MRGRAEGTLSSRFPWYARNGSWCVCGEGCSWDWEPDRLRCWFMPYLPDFDFQNQNARRFSIDNAIEWARDTGVDGFRLDAVKHIDMSWLTGLRARLKQFMATEVRGDRAPELGAPDRERLRALGYLQ